VEDSQGVINAVVGPEERRKSIMSALASASVPITGQDLSTRLGVSRQVIVQDIAVLRAHGEQVVATPTGYVLASKASPARAQATLACKHGAATVREELMIIVGLGGEVIDVIVEHPVYGQITGLLMLRSVRDVDGFMEKIRTTGASLLATLTRGVHLHTIRAPNAVALRKIAEELRTKGFLLDEDS